MLSPGPVEPERGRAPPAEGSQLGKSFLASQPLSSESASGWWRFLPKLNLLLVVKAPGFLSSSEKGRRVCAEGSLKKEGRKNERGRESWLIGFAISTRPVYGDPSSPSFWGVSACG